MQKTKWPDLEQDTLDLIQKNHQKSRSRLTTLDLEHQQLAKKKHKVNKKPPHKGGKQPLQDGRETSTSLNYPK